MEKISPEIRVRIKDKWADFLLEKNKEFQIKVKNQEDVLNLVKKVPTYPILILTCMDPRINIYKIFNLNEDDIFVLRNAGNVITEDVIRSILISIHEFNIELIIILGHVDCGITKINPTELMNKLTPEMLKKIGHGGNNIPLEIYKYFVLFRDELANIKRQVFTLVKSKLIPSNIKISGMLYDVNSGWVFDHETLLQFESMEHCMKDYKGLIYSKNQEIMKQIMELESKKDKELNVEKKNEKEEKESIITKEPKIELNNEKKEESININMKLDILEPLKNELEISKENFQKIFMPKISIPKIYIPKIKVYIPKINKSLPSNENE